MYYIKATDGCRIAVEDIHKDAKETIVLVHGWPLSKEMYEYQKGTLNDAGYRIVSFDLRGFGDSEVTSTGYDYDQLATDLHSVIESLSVDSVYLVGFSMGGAICVRYMSLFQNEKVSKLILAGAAAPSFDRSKNNPYGNSVESTETLLQSLYKDRENAIDDFGNKVFALEHSSSFKKWFRDLGFKASYIGTFRTALSLKNEDVFEDLSKISVPTLIMHGRMDQICPYGLALIMNEQIKGSLLDTFEYSGHGLFYDERMKFDNDLLLFIKKNECI